MSLTSTRGIAKAALLTAAGAASVVGAAGAASALDADAAPALGGVNQLDGDGLGNTVDSTTQDAAGFTGEKGGETVEQALPVVGEAAGSAAKSVLPKPKGLDDTRANTGAALEDTTSSATDQLGGVDGLDTLGKSGDSNQLGTPAKLLGGLRFG